MSDIELARDLINKVGNLVKKVETLGRENAELKAELETLKADYAAVCAERDAYREVLISINKCMLDEKYEKYGAEGIITHNILISDLVLNKYK